MTRTEKNRNIMIKKILFWLRIRFVNRKMTSELNLLFWSINKLWQLSICTASQAIHFHKKMEEMFEYVIVTQYSLMWAKNLFYEQKFRQKIEN